MQDLSLFIASHLGLVYAFAGTLLALLLVEGLRAKNMTFRINPSKAIELINHHNASVIDIRSNEQFRKGHIISAIPLSKDDLVKESPRLKKLKSQPVIITCDMGMESQKIAASLIQSGYQAYSLSGGTRGWQNANLPLSKE